MKELATIAGIDAVLAVVPYYNKPNQEGMYQHFKTIAEASELPIILYNVPGRTAACLEVETTLRLAQLEKIVAIKECAGLDAITELIERAPKDFLVYTGEDGLAFATKALGGQGVISVASHVFGSSMYEMYQALEQGDLPEAAKIQRIVFSAFAGTRESCLKSFRYSCWKFTVTSSCLYTRRRAKNYSHVRDLKNV